MIENSWTLGISRGFFKEGRDFSVESTLSSIRMMDENAQKGLLFDAIRACEIPAIKNILQINRSLVVSKIFGFEGSDVYEIIPNSKTKRCYKYTGLEKDGYFYPLHVAAEAGHKKLTIMLIKAGADVNMVDYRGEIAEQKCNGDAQYAFFELRGLFYEARERYEGRVDREGRKIGQGTMYYKPEGYLSEDNILYRGGYKDNFYHGHGNLNWPGTNTPRFVGRFKKGEQHGYGLEYDKHGMKIYQGNFRYGQREGRGEEFTENVVVYRGEYSKDTRHGFGVALFGDSHIYIGRFENNNMAGVGIYCHPNGDRFEGMFYNNKPDGPGSFFELDVTTNVIVITYALWQKGRKLKDLTGQFVPKGIDLPDERSQSLLSAMAAEEEKLLKEIEETPDYEVIYDADGRVVLRSGKEDSASYAASVAKRASKEGGNWKNVLAKYCKLTAKECVMIGLEASISLATEALVKSNDKDGVDDDDGDHDAVLRDEDEHEDMINDVNGIHFMDFTTLFVAYLYVYSAAKVFEGRIAGSHMSESVPDFEAVYHIVLDAVEGYNDLWEKEYQLQEESKASLESTTNDGDGKKGSGANSVESKRLLFMSEREKRDEELLRQRTELAAKKGIGQLEKAREQRIQNEILAYLHDELMKLISDENEEDFMVHMAAMSAPKYQAKKDSRDSSNPASHGADEGYIEENEFVIELLHIIRTSQNAVV